MSFFQEKKLGQVMPDGSATAVTLVATQINTTFVIKNIFICNKGAATTFSIHHGISSSASVTQATCLFSNVDLSASSTLQLTCYIPVESSGEAIAVKVGAPELVFTAYGAEIIETPYNEQ